MERQTELTSWQPERANVFWFLAVLMVSAAFLRLIPGYTRVHFFDLSYYVDWSAGAVQDIFGAYENVGNLDYPPLFLFFLFFSGKLMQLEAVKSFEPYQMLALKGWQMLFDLALIVLIYFVLRRRNELFALGAAALWAVNPTAIYNSSYWGQTDCIMIFMLVLVFWLLEEERPAFAGFVMALACLMKFQSLYFAPLFALTVISGFSLKKILQTVATGVCTVIVVFSPFMLRSGILLPWEIYAGGFEQYQGASLNAFNYYGASGLNYQHSNTPVLGSLTANSLSVIMLFVALGLLVFFFYTATEKSPWLLGFVFMQMIFMFTTRMHERYQIPTVAFALLSAVVHKSRSMFIYYGALTAMTFLNHFIVLEHTFSSEKTAWMAYYDLIVVVLSLVNLALCMAGLLVAVRVFYRHGYYGFCRSFRASLPNDWSKQSLDSTKPDPQTQL